MASLRGRRRTKKAAISNTPSAGRGRDRFTLVSADLEAKREKLAAQLETPLSMVKFALGSHKIAPIILSKSMKKGSGHGGKKKSAGLFPEERLAVDGKGGLQNEGEASDQHIVINEEKTHVTGLIHGNGTHLGDGNSDKQRTQLSNLSSKNTIDEDKSEQQLTLPGEISSSEEITQQEAQCNGFSSRRDSTTLGDFLGVQRNDLGEIMEVFSASMDVERIEHTSNEKRSTRGSWMATKASTLVSNVVFFRRRPTKSSVRKARVSMDKTSLPQQESIDEAHTLSAARVSSSSAASTSSSPLKRTRTVIPEIVPLPSPPARVKIARNTNPADQAISSASTQNSSPSAKGGSKKHRKGRGGCFPTMRSAPSTPRNSREPQKPFSTSSTITKAQGLNDQVTHTDGVKEEERSILQKHLDRQNAASKTRFFPRVSATENAPKEIRNRSRLDQALAATGLMLSLAGLMVGCIPAIMGVVCWWYALPVLRWAVGDKPVMRSHHQIEVGHGSDRNARLLPAGSESNETIREACGDGSDTQSFKNNTKRVIMEGLLDRGRRSNS